MPVSMAASRTNQNDTELNVSWLGSSIGDRLAHIGLGKWLGMGLVEVQGLLVGHLVLQLLRVLGVLGVLGVLRVQQILVVQLGRVVQVVQGFELVVVEVVEVVVEVEGVVVGQVGRRLHNRQGDRQGHKLRDSQQHKL